MAGAGRAAGDEGARGGGWSATGWSVAIVLAGAAAAVWLWARDVIRPGSMARHEARAGVRGLGVAEGMGGIARAMGHAPGSFFLVAALGVVVVQAVAGQVAGMVVGRVVGAEEAGGIAGTVVRQGVTYAVVIGAGVGLLWVLAGTPAIAGGAGAGGGRVEGRLGESLRLGLMVGGGEVRRAVLGTVALVPIAMGAGVVAAAAHRLGGGVVEPLGHETLRVLVDGPGGGWMWGLVGLAVVGAPLAEEVVFRGLVQTGVRRLTGSAWAGILGTGLVFAAIHLGGGIGAGQWYALAPVLVVGIGCGIAYERSGSLWVAIAMHAGFNAVNVGLAVAMAG